MAVITVCDICRKEVSEQNGVDVAVSDNNGLDFFGGVPTRGKRKYTAKICDKCLENIKNYCRDHKGD